METQTQYHDGAGSATAGVFRMSLSERAIFRKEGEYWTVAIGDRAVRLKDSKGLAYLACLLRYPETEFHVLDLAGAINRTGEDDRQQLVCRTGRCDNGFESAGMHIDTLGDAGEQLDDQAKREYRLRLSELREELEEAKAQGRVERSEQIEDEIETITRELSRAVGLGGRNRRAASASERARQSITKSIKAVLGRIAESDTALAEFFSRSIKTGSFCSYQPNAPSPIWWVFGATNEGESAAVLDREPAQQQEDRLERLSNGVALFSSAEQTPLVGREHETALVRAAIDAKLNGRGSIVMIGGGPGVGKTRLAMDGAEYAERNAFCCMVGRCYERTTAVPYLPFVEIIETYLARAANLGDFREQMGVYLPEMARLAPRLRRVFSDIPDLLELPPEQMQRYLFQGVSEGLARVAQKQPQLLILEDLHWADESTLALLSHLANFVRPLPILIIGTYRDGLSDDNAALVLLLEELIRAGIRPLKLGGLSRDSVAKMLNGLSHREVPETLVSAIFAESDGNPFFVEEIYRHLLEEGKIFDDAGRLRTEIEIDELDVPENVKLVLGRRLARLSDNARQVLTAAALVGRSFSFMLLRAILDRADPDMLFAGLEETQRTGFITSSFEGPEAPFVFTHELVRQTLLTEISQPRQQRLHGKIAEALERMYGTRIEEHVAEVAHHLLKGQPFADPDKACHYLSLAGGSAERGGAGGSTANPGGRACLSANGCWLPRADSGASSFRWLPQNEVWATGMRQSSTCRSR